MSVGAICTFGVRFFFVGGVVVGLFVGLIVAVIRISIMPTPVAPVLDSGLVLSDAYLFAAVFFGLVSVFLAYVFGRYMITWLVSLAQRLSGNDFESRYRRGVAREGVDFITLGSSGRRSVSKSSRPRPRRASPWMTGAGVHGGRSRLGRVRNKRGLPF